jgi:uncharacterized protein YcbX
MLLKVHEDPLSPLGHKFENIHIATFPQTSLFTATLRIDDDELLVEYNPPPGLGMKDVIQMPLNPNVDDLESIQVEMHKSPTKAYNMGSQYNEWFSKRFGFLVVFAYLGSHRRAVLGNVSPNAENRRNKSNSSLFRNSISSILGAWTPKDTEGITFADIAPFLVVSTTSLDQVSPMLPEHQQMDITKFRPNIIVSGSPTPYDEDFWGELSIGNPQLFPEEKAAASILLTQNCARCQSINVNYETGKPGEDERGKVLKKLMKDRRVDSGTKYSPVFGRYGFASPESVGRTVRIGDKVEIIKRNVQRTTFGEYKFYLCKLIFSS